MYQSLKNSSPYSQPSISEPFRPRRQRPTSATTAWLALRSGSHRGKTASPARDCAGCGGWGDPCAGEQSSRQRAGPGSSGDTAPPLGGVACDAVLALPLITALTVAVHQPCRRCAQGRRSRWAAFCCLVASKQSRRGAFLGDPRIPRDGPRATSGFGLPSARPGAVHVQRTAAAAVGHARTDVPSSPLCPHPASRLNPTASGIPGSTLGDYSGPPPSVAGCGALSADEKSAHADTWYA